MHVRSLTLCLWKDDTYSLVLAPRRWNGCLKFRKRCVSVGDEKKLDKPAGSRRSSSATARRQRVEIKLYNDRETTGFRLVFC